MGSVEVGAFLSNLASEGRSAHPRRTRRWPHCCSSINKCSDASWNGWATWFTPNGPSKVPVVLGRQEVRDVLARLQGPVWLVCSLLYGAGLRLLEALRLRVKDIDLDRREIIVRRGKGQKDRRTVLPSALVEKLRSHLATVKAQHESDLALGAGAVVLPEALARKYPSAPREWSWQWVFPATRTYTDPATGDSAATTCTKPSSSAPSAKPPSPPTSPSPSPRTRCAIPSQPTCWKTATTSAPSKSCSATAT
jgi:integrase